MAEQQPHKMCYTTATLTSSAVRYAQNAQPCVGVRL